MKDKINQIQKSFKKDLEKVNSLPELKKLKQKYLSKKNGLTTKLLKKLPKLSSKEKREFGPQLNKLKTQQEKTLNDKRLKIKNDTKKASTLDLTIPQPPSRMGMLHPTTQIIRQMNEFFRYWGYSIEEGPEIESAEYNFRKLNLPEGHPATDLQDTLFIDEPNILLRTQTSSIEARVLSEKKPPIRFVAPGAVYRNETENSTNAAHFYHYQGVVVDKNINIQHLKSTLTCFHQFLFGKDVKLRFRYKYYPEVSPGMGVDMQCRFCSGKGCKVCKHRGWIEMLGSGMIHYNTLKDCGINPDEYTGFAFGLGLDRLVMSKFNINDIRKLYGGKIAYKLGAKS